MNEHLKKKFNDTGYFTLKNFIDKNSVNKILKEISEAKDVDVYKDRNNIIRRVERIYNKGQCLNAVNDQFIALLKKVLGLDVSIFKDKFNLKPPQGEGFYAHYDGVFYFIDDKKKKRKGWYEYGNKFVNILLALDDSNEDNGTIEIASSHENTFENLIKNTKNDGTPNLLEHVENKTIFEKINLNAGDIVIFKNTCPHRSKKNTSEKSRRILYYTYLSLEFGKQYQNYFKDKSKSQNKSSKSLSGEK